VGRRHNLHLDVEKNPEIVEARMEAKVDRATITPAQSPDQPNAATRSGEVSFKSGSLSGTSDRCAAARD
jgi:hypothetical protein